MAQSFISLPKYNYIDGFEPTKPNKTEGKMFWF